MPDGVSLSLLTQSDDMPLLAGMPENLHARSLARTSPALRSGEGMTGGCSTEVTLHSYSVYTTTIPHYFASNSVIPPTPLVRI